MPVDIMPAQCEMRPYDRPLFANVKRMAKVKLPPGAKLRQCNNAADGAQIITAPDSGGTEMCVIYEYDVDYKIVDVILRRERTGVAKARADKSCPALDFSGQNYPGKEWVFLSDNLPLANAFKVRAAVEKGGLAFLKQEKSLPKDGAVIDFGSTPLQVESIAPTEQLECRQSAGLFQGRYAACYRAKVYNQSIRGNWWLVLGLTKDNEYKILQSIRTPPLVPVRRQTR